MKRSERDYKRMLAHSKQLTATIEAMLGDGPDGHDIEEAGTGLQIARQLVDALDIENERPEIWSQEELSRRLSVVIDDDGVARETVVDEEIFGSVRDHLDWMLARFLNREAGFKIE